MHFITVKGRHGRLDPISEKIASCGGTVLKKESLDPLDPTHGLIKHTNDTVNAAGTNRKTMNKKWRIK